VRQEMGRCTDMRGRGKKKMGIRKGKANGPQCG